MQREWLEHCFREGVGLNCSFITNVISRFQFTPRIKLLLTDDIKLVAFSLEVSITRALKFPQHHKDISCVSQRAEDSRGINTSPFARVSCCPVRRLSWRLLGSQKRACSGSPSDCWVASVCIQGCHRPAHTRLFSSNLSGYLFCFALTGSSSSATEAPPSSCPA